MLVFEVRVAQTSFIIFSNIRFHFSEYTHILCYILGELALGYIKPALIEKQTYVFVYYTHRVRSVNGKFMTFLVALIMLAV